MNATRRLPEVQRRATCCGAGPLFVVAMGCVSAISCASKLKVPTSGGPAPADEQPKMLRAEGKRQLPQAIAPKIFPPIPPAAASGAEVPAGFRVEVVVRDLVYPTSLDFDDKGNMYVAEAGASYGDPAAPARIFRIAPSGKMAIIAEQLSAPITDILWHKGRLYVSHWGKISAIEGGKVQDLVTDLPATWDHHNNQLSIGPDGKLYFGMGTATNSGVVGLDNISPFLWLLFYPDMHDVPPFDLELEDVSYTTPDPLTVLANQGELVSFSAAAEHLASPSEPLLVETGAFQPFGKKADKVTGRVKSNGTILRLNTDGSGLEVYAWGLRNPFGVLWGPDSKLYAADNGYDERGSRPIANAPDCIWVIKQGAFYGFPDFSCGTPVTDPRFKSQRGPEPKFLLKNHPPVEKALLTRPPHAGVTKIDFSRSPKFGFQGQMFLGEVGSGTPINAPGDVPSGYQVVTVDLGTRAATPFFWLRRDALGPAGYEHAVTKGPRRPVDVRFSPDGAALYIVDFGALVAFPAGGGPLAHPYPGSGVVWRVVRDGAAAARPPPDLSPLPPREIGP